MGEQLVISAELFKYWHIDLQNGTITIVRQDGQVHQAELETKYRPGKSQIATSTFDWEKWWIISTTTRGELIFTEGFNPSSSPPLNGRPSVYLDQNHWRTVVDTLRNPERTIDDDERRAALDLIHLASDDGIVLPLSMGHMIETAGLYGERRYDVGVVMAQLASGWQIRNPIDLWKHEAELAMRERLGIADDGPILHPIATEPGALFGANSTLAISAKNSDIEKFMAMLTMPSAILDTLIDPEPTTKHPLTRWIEHHARITSQMQVPELTKDQRRLLARRRFWNENIGFYTAAYRHLTHSADFPLFNDRELVGLFSRSPMAGLLSEVFVRRFIDRDNKWRRNDLIDLFHLSSGAAYADYVCAEAHTGIQLRQAQRNLGRSETVFTALSDLVAALRRNGARADSERCPDRRDP